MAAASGGCWRRLGAALFALLLAGCAGVPVQPPRGADQARLARSHFVTPDGAVLPVRSWQPGRGAPRAIVIAVHGFNDYSRAFASPGQYLSQRGIALIAYDQRGFGNAPGRGRWAGEAAYAGDLLALIRQVRRQQPGVPVYVLGESMGGAVAMVALTRPDAPGVAGLILSAPAVWSREHMPWYQRLVLALASSTLPALEVTGSGLNIQASDNIEMLRGLGRDPLVIKSTRVDALEGLVDLMGSAQARAGQLRVPVLVLYGARDQVIPAAPLGAALARLPRLPGNRSVVYAGGYHLLLRDLRADLPLGDIARWIDRGGRPVERMALAPERLSP